MIELALSNSLLGQIVALAISASVASSLAQAQETGGQEAVEESANPYVRPDVQAYLDNLAANPRPAMTREMIAMVRQLPPEMLNSEATGDFPVGELGEVRDLTMPGPGGDIALRLFDPRAASEREPGPVVVFYHGGAFTVGSIGTHSGLAAEMARRLDLPVASVEYRLAPENPWPAAPDDAEAAARWIAANGSALDREFTGLVLSGDSAGGNLTLVTALALRDEPAAVPVRMQLPIYPSTNRTRRYESARLFGKGYALDLNESGEDLYMADPASWRSSPLLADLHGLPPTVLVTAGLDPLRDEGRAFAAKLVEAGVSTAYYEAHGNIHGFATYRRAIPSAQQDTVEFLAMAKTMLDAAQ